jgi:hypothetical protein
MAWDRFFRIVRELLDLASKHGPKIHEWWNGLRATVSEWWNGKKLAIIGPTAVGKNSFYNRLQGNPIPNEHINTKAVENIPKFTLQRHLHDGKVFQITVKRSTNVGGEKEQRDRFWFDACKGSDVIFYMLSLEDLKKQSYKSGGRVHEDLEWLAEHIGQMKSNPKIHFLVNKLDLELGQSADYDSFVEQLKPLVMEFEDMVRRILGGYKARITGISATSMMDDGIFHRSFALILESVYDAVHRKRKATSHVGTSTP